MNQASRSLTALIGMSLLLVGCASGPPKPHTYISNAKKAYKTGELYRKMGYPQAAVISYDVVLTEYYDTQYTDDALYWKGECQLKQMAWEDAIQSFNTLMERYPESPWVTKAKTKQEIALEKQRTIPNSEEHQE